MIVWEPGKRYKLNLVDGAIYTATVVGVEGNILIFNDKHGARVAVNIEHIVRSTELTGDHNE